MRRLRLLMILAVLALVAPGLTASTAARQDAPAMIEQLNLGDFGGGSNPQSNFNPYGTNNLYGATTWIFEPLMIVNGYSCVAEPWLATEFSWTDNQTLNFTIRDGVTWSDGTPFTAEDVIFSYKMTQAFPALDTDQLWAILNDVTATGNVVTFSFKEPAGSKFNAVVDNPIVPRHLWEGVADPVTFTNDTPVGTGPFTLGQWNRTELRMVRNPTYWQAEKVMVQELVYTKSEGDANVNQLRLAEGRYDWHDMAIPDVQRAFVDKDPEHNKYWFPAGGPVSLMMNLTKVPFNDVEFRRGIAYALDRESMVQRAVYGYTGPATQTGLVLPNQEIFLDPTIENQGFLPYNVDLAKQTLTAAGYTYDGDELIGKDGNRVSVVFSVPASYTDWVQAAEILRENLEAIGIDIQVQASDPTIVESDRKAGNFDMVFDVPAGGCNVYEGFLYPFANSDAPLPVGEEATRNYMRWQDPETADLMNRLRVATDLESQVPILHGIQQIMVNELPYITLYYGPTWFEYRTEHAVGWPSPEDPYAHPGNRLIIITHLTPAPA